MTRLIRLKRGTLVGLVLAVGSCQGELKMDGGQTTKPMDGSVALVDMTQSSISFAQINADFDKAILGCTGTLTACHGVGNPNGYTLVPNAGASQAMLMANYQQTLLQVSLNMPAASLLVTRPLATAPPGDMGAHPGGTPFANTSNPTYQRWLLWIQLGAHFDAVSTTSSSDMASPPTDGANGGG